VSEKTGYPLETLELEMDIESDLGIDSIKRVEILGAMQSLYPALPRLKPEELAELRTLRQIVAHMGTSLYKADETHGAAAPHAPRSEPEPVADHKISRRIVRLTSLPAPDFLEITLPAGRICLLTDDGTPTTFKLAQALAERSWPVAVLSFPRSVIAGRSHLPESVRHLALENMSEAHLQQTLDAIERRHGRVGIFIHLNTSVQAFPLNGSLFHETEKAGIKHIFLMAKLLKESLNESARQGYGCFMTVARLNGDFGFGNGTPFGAIGGGLFGLTKTLNLEWSEVFCRAIDLHPEVDPDRAVQHILTELHDPNRLIVEVGYGAAGRSTPVAEL